jgi:hypothetical protein
VVRLLDRMLHLYYASVDTKAMALMALLKLTARFTDAGVLARVRRIIASFEGSSEVELQARSVEFTTIADPAKVPVLDEHRAGLLAPMPLLEEGVLRARAGAGTGATTDAAGLGGEDEAMKVVERTRAKGVGAPSGSGSAHMGDLLEGLGVAAPAPAAGGAGGGSMLDDLNDLLGMGGLAPAPAPPAAGGKGKPAGAGAGGAGALDLDALFSTVATGAGDVFSATTTTIPTPIAAAPAPSPMATVDAVFGAHGVAAMGAGGGAAAPAPALSLAAGGSLKPAAAAAATGGAAAGSTATVAALSSTLDALFSHVPAPAPAPTLTSLAAPAPAPPAAAKPAAAPAAAHGAGGGGDDEFGGFEDAPPSLALPVVFTAYESARIKAVFRCEKPGGLAAPTTDIHATFTATGGGVSNFLCQVAPPKFIKLALQPASGTVLGGGGGGSVTQVIRVDNSQVGVKAIVLKLRFQFTPDGSAEQVVENADVKGFPLGL